jgi:hypothetical protein
MRNLQDRAVLTHPSPQVTYGPLCPSINCRVQMSMATTRGLLALMTLALAHPASAVCLDPKTFASGYHVPLSAEVRSTMFIAVGTVIGAMALQEDASDPEGVTAHLWSVKLIRQLKGHAPRNIIVRVENDSGRYLMSAGEEHLLFLTKGNGFYSVNSCGNSSSLANRRAALRQVEAALRDQRNAP